MTTGERIPTRANFGPYLPVILLCFVAGVQLWLSRTQHLAPWKGGGFGMFSTTDAAASRRLRIHIEGPGLNRMVPVPPPLEASAYRAEAFPSERRLIDIARRAAVLERARVGRIDHIRVEVVRVVYDPVSLTPRTESIRQVAFEVPTARP